MELIYYSSNRSITDIEDVIFVSGKEIENSNGIVITEDKNNLFCIAKGVQNYDYGNFASRQLIKFFNEKNIKSKEDLISTLYEYKEFLENLSYKDYIEGIIVKKPQFAVIVGGILKLNSELIIFNVGNIITYRILVNKIVKLSKEQNVYSDLYYNGLLSTKEENDTRKKLLTSFISNKKNFFDIYFNKINLLKNDKLLIVNDFMYETLEEYFLDIFRSKNPIEKIELLIKEKKIKNELAFIFIKN
jgi:serine/threonine protein phosphatase PrpC